jgi:ribokinase
MCADAVLRCPAMARRRDFDLISIGDTTTDVFLNLRQASMHMDRANAFFCVTYADKVPVEGVVELLGVGNAANNAVGGARLGLRTALWTMLGDDVVGHRTARRVFPREGVNTRYIEFDRRHGTNFSVVLDFQAERTILVYHEHRTYRFPRLSPAWLLYLTSMGRGWEAIVPQLLRYLRRTGARLAFNPGTHQLSANPRVLRRVLAATHVLMVNKEEALRLLGTSASPRALLQGLQKFGPRTVVVTDGARGSYAAADREMWSMPAISTRVVEMTGAGDSFAIGFYAARFYGRPLPDALLWGALNAAAKIQQIGGQAGLLTRDQMETRAKRPPARARILT